MGKIKNIVFDLGGVIIDLDRDEPVRRLIEIGVKDADGLIDPYEQKGVFQDLETGKIEDLAAAETATEPAPSQE